MTFRDAILRHRGETSNVTEHFENLSEADQSAIIELLNLSNGSVTQKRVRAPTL